MKNVIKNTIYKIGKIYIGNDISELYTYLKNIENDLLKLNKNWKIDDFSNKVVEELEKNRVLEIAIYNLKKSNNNIICPADFLTNYYILTYLRTISQLPLPRTKPN